MDKLTNRQLNRATLARQMLLERSDIDNAEAVRFLGGLQAQQSNDPYIALWSRLSGFRHEDLTALIVNRTLARATTMRGTLHLHTADDLIGFRALVADFLKAMWKSNFLKRFGNEDEKKVLRAGVKLLDAKAPMTAGALGKALQEKFPTAEPLAMSVLLQVNETLVQVPPTRIWGNGSAPMLTTALPHHSGQGPRCQDFPRRRRCSGRARPRDRHERCRMVTTMLNGMTAAGSRARSAAATKRRATQKVPTPLFRFLQFSAVAFFAVRDRDHLTSCRAPSPASVRQQHR